MSTHGEVRDTWIPVERRWLGLDRRTLLPGLVVLLVALLLRTVVPFADRAIPVDDVVRPGDRLDLGGGLTLTPPVGWALSDGILVGAPTVQPGTGSPSAAFSGDGVGAQVRVAPFSGNADALLDQINRNDTLSRARPDFTVTGARTAVPAAGGLTGVAETYGSTSGDGILAAYALPDGRGVVIEVAGTVNQLAANAAPIDAVLRSLSLEAQR